METGQKSKLETGRRKLASGPASIFHFPFSALAIFYFLFSIFPVAARAATPAYVQSGGADSNSVALSGVTAAHALYALIYDGAGAGQTLAVSSTHETWAAVSIVSNLATDGDTLGIGCAIAGASGSDTITALGNGSAYGVRLIVYEVSGATCTLDSTTPAGGYSATDSVQSATVPSGALSTSTANDFVVFLAGNAFGAGAYALTSSLADPVCVNGGGLGCTSTVALPLMEAGSAGVATSPGAISAAWTINPSYSQEWGSILAAFQPAGPHNYAASPSETNTASDSITRHVDYGRGASESNSSSDAVSRLGQFYRGDSIVLSWLPPSGAAGNSAYAYNIYRGTSPGNETGPINASPVDAGCSSQATCSYVDYGPQAGTEYYYTITTVYGGVQSAVSDEVGAVVPTDAVLEALSTSDSTTINQQTVTNYSAQMSESGGASDRLARAGVFARSPAPESNPASDVVAKQTAFVRSPSPESNPASDALARLGQFGRTPSPENNPATDFLARLGTFLRSSLTETNQALDTLAGNLSVPGTYVANMNESLASADSIVRQGVYARPNSESNAASDTLGRLGTFARTLPPESNSAGDLLARLGQFARTLPPESNPANETLARLGKFARTDLEPLSLVDLLATSHAAPGRYEASFGETLSTSDMLSRVGAFARALEQSDAATDLLTGNCVGCRASPLPRHHGGVPGQPKAGAVTGRTKTGAAPVH